MINGVEMADRKHILTSVILFSLQKCHIEEAVLSRTSDEVSNQFWEASSPYFCPSNQADELILLGHYFAVHITTCELNIKIL